jgi:hypothetical protein
VPILGLFVLAPVVAEAVGSGNLPTIVLLNPALLFLFGLLYGVPALLVRELGVRGRVGWAGLLLLGFAYGAFNEGIVAGTWFDPEALDFPSSALGRVGDVNWNLVAGLTVFHTFVSMFIPIALAELWFEARRGRPWLRTRGIVVCTLVVVLITIGNVAGDGEGEAGTIEFRSQRLTTVLVLLAAVALALVLPRWHIPRSDRDVPSVRRVFALGFVWFALYLFCFFGMSRIEPRAVVVLVAGLWAAAVTALLRWTGSSQWTRRHTLLLCAGTLAPSMILTSVRVTALQPLSSALFVWLLVRLDRRLRAAQPS